MMASEALSDWRYVLNESEQVSWSLGGRWFCDIEARGCPLVMISSDNPGS